jgi:signal transduction histidine kinase
MISEDEQGRRRFWQRFGLGLALWTLIGLTDATHSYFLYASRRDPISWPQALGMGLTLWYGWALLALLIFPFCRRFPVEARNWPLRLLLHAGAAVAFALVKLAMDYPVIKTFYCPQPHLLTFPRFYRMALTSHFQPYLLVYFSLAGVSHAVAYSRRYREREGRATQLESQLAGTHLQLLKMQLRPHFLLNSLNAVAAMIPADAEAAERMLARLGDLLRQVLDHDGVQEVPLEEEFDFLRAYLELEQIRFGPRLQIRLDVAPEAREGWIPYLLLQPLVENAIRHGLATKRGGHLSVRARRVESTLQLQVEDDGPGLATLPVVHEGVGLSNTRDRLRRLYGDRHRIELSNRLEGGVRVLVEIPFREENGAEVNGNATDSVDCALTPG